MRRNWTRLVRVAAGGQTACGQASDVMALDDVCRHESVSAIVDRSAIRFPLVPHRHPRYPQELNLGIALPSFMAAGAELKTQPYRDLVAARKACRRCAGLCNPADVDNGSLDSDHVGPWCRWQGNLDAPLMVVGQDWGDTRYLRKHGGVEGAGNPTNITLVKLLGTIGIEIGHPGDLWGQDIVFFTNAILCLKEGGLQGVVQAEWFTNCRPFLRAQIEIVRPAVVVGLGQRAYESVMAAFGFKARPFAAAVEDPIGQLLPTGGRLFAVYHCGARILNTHRPLERQIEDWGRIGRVLQAGR